MPSAIERVAAQLDVQPDLLGELVVQAIAAEERPHRVREIMIVPSTDSGSGRFQCVPSTGFITRVIASISRVKLDSAIPSRLRPAAVRR